MGDTSIQWTDKVWNPVRGCSRVSQGCVNCYAERQAVRFAGDGGSFQGFAHRVNGHAAWTGKVELVEKHIEAPLSWRQPKRVFVNSMSDLFHEELPDDSIDRVFAVMAAARHHTFQILTKRSTRMLRYLQKPEWMNRLTQAAARYIEKEICSDIEDLATWPLPNVWLGVSCEDQKTANERIRLLLQTPAAVRFVSYEPALGPVDFRSFIPDCHTIPVGHAGLADFLFGDYLDWIIVGGESGPGARPFNIAWARNTIKQCKAAGVACFVKQLGSRPTNSLPGNDRPPFNDRKGGDISEWPEDLRVREFPQ